MYVHMYVHMCVQMCVQMCGIWARCLRAQTLVIPSVTVLLLRHPMDVMASALWDYTAVVVQ